MKELNLVQIENVAGGDVCCYCNIAMSGVVALVRSSDECFNRCCKGFIASSYIFYPPASNLRCDNYTDSYAAVEGCPSRKKLIKQQRELTVQRLMEEIKF